MEGQSEFTREALMGLQERSMASCVEVLQQVDELEHKMTDMSKELCESIRNLIKEEFDNQLVFSTIEREYERTENAKKRIDRIQQMIFGFSCNTQNIFQRASVSSTTKHSPSASSNSCVVTNGTDKSKADDETTKVDNSIEQRGSPLNETTPADAKRNASPRI